MPHLDAEKEFFSRMRTQLGNLVLVAINDGLENGTDREAIVKDVAKLINDFVASEKELSYIDGIEHVKGIVEAQGSWGERNVIKSRILEKIDYLLYNLR